MLCSRVNYVFFITVIAEIHKILYESTHVDSSLATHFTATPTTVFLVLIVELFLSLSFSLLTNVSRTFRFTTLSGEQQAQKPTHGDKCCGG